MLQVLCYLPYLFMSYTLKILIEILLGPKHLEPFSFSTPFPTTISEVITDILPLIVQHMAAHGMPCHTTDHQVLPTHFLRRQRTALGVASILLMCQPTYLAWLKPQSH